MPLSATSLVVSDSAWSVAIIDVDSMGFDMDWTAKIIDAVVEAAWVICHSVPQVMRAAVKWRYLPCR